LKDKKPQKKRQKKFRLLLDSAFARPAKFIRLGKAIKI